MWEHYFHQRPPQNDRANNIRHTIVALRSTYDQIQCRRLNCNLHRIDTVFAKYRTLCAAFQRQYQSIRGYPLPILSFQQLVEELRREPFMEFLGALERNAVQPDLMTALGRFLNDQLPPQDCPDLLLAVMRFGKFHRHPIGNAIREIYRWLREEGDRKERYLSEKWTAFIPIWESVISPEGIEDAAQRIQWYRDVCTWIECERVAQWEKRVAAAIAFGAFVQAWSGIPQIDVVEQYHQFGRTVECVAAGLRYARDAHTVQRLFEQPEMQSFDLNWWAHLFVPLFDQHLRVEDGRVVDNGILQLITAKAAEQFPRLAEKDQEDLAFLFQSIFISMSKSLGTLLQQVGQSDVKNDVIHFWVHLVQTSHISDHLTICKNDLEPILAKYEGLQEDLLRAWEAAGLADVVGQLRMETVVCS